MDSSVSIVKFYKHTRTARRRRMKQDLYDPYYGFSLTGSGAAFLERDTLTVPEKDRKLHTFMEMLFDEFPYDAGMLSNPRSEALAIAMDMDEGVPGTPGHASMVQKSWFYYVFKAMRRKFICRTAAC